MSALRGWRSSTRSSAGPSLGPGSGSRPRAAQGCARNGELHHNRKAPHQPRRALQTAPVELGAGQGHEPSFFPRDRPMIKVGGLAYCNRTQQAALSGKGRDERTCQGVTRPGAHVYPRRSPAAKHPSHAQDYSHNPNRIRIGDGPCMEERRRIVYFQAGLS